VFKAQESKIPQNEASATAYSNAMNTLINATYSGARNMGSWWVKQSVDNGDGKDPVIRYRLWILFTIPRKNLDSQMNGKIEELKQGNPELSAAFDSISVEIMQKGLEWDAGTKAEVENIAATLKEEVGPLK
jgi:hypothetical protein